MPSCASCSHLTKLYKQQPCKATSQCWSPAGVIWRGDSLIDGVPETLDALRKMVRTHDAGCLKPRCHLWAGNVASGCDQAAALMIAGYRDRAHSPQRKSRLLHLVHSLDYELACCTPQCQSWQLPLLGL